jgi:DNA-binding MarR family transcriptional regulator
MSEYPPASVLGDAIKQTRPFGGLEHLVFLAIQRAAADLTQQAGDLLRPYAVSGAQYNVLRILRGASGEGLACGEIADRLIARDPDMTRLLDRMQKQGLVTRSRASDDRRVVVTRITAEGLRIVGELDEPMAALHRRQLGHLGPTRLRDLAALLDEVLASQEAAAATQ